MDLSQKIPVAAQDIKKLMAAYRDAQADLRSKKQAHQEAAKHAEALRTQIEAAIAQNGFDVYRALYTHEYDDTGQTVRLRRVASGLNLSLPALLDPVLASSDSAAAGAFDPRQAHECGEVCEQALNGQDTRNMACICDCLDLGDAGPMTAVTCVSGKGSFPQAEAPGAG